MLVSFFSDRLRPLRRRLLPVVTHAAQQRGDAGADIAHQRCGDLDVAVHLARLDVDLDELLRARLPPLPALAVAEQPVEPRADHQHDVAVGEHGRARGGGALRMQVRKQALGHAHRDVRNAALLDQRADVVVGLRIGGALAEDDQRTLGAAQHVECTLDGGGAGICAGAGSITLTSERRPASTSITWPNSLRGQVEIHAARAAGHRGADRARDADADVGRMQHAERRLAQRPGDGELVHLLVVALLQVDDFAFGRTADQDHRKAVRRRIGQRDQAVQEARRRDREAHARRLRQEARDRRRVAGVLLVAERDHAHAVGLRQAAQVGDRDAGHVVDRLDAVQLQRVDDQVEPVGQFGFGFAGGLLKCCGTYCSPYAYCRRRSSSGPVIRSRKSPCCSTCAASPIVCSRTSRSARSASRRSSAAMMAR